MEAMEKAVNNFVFIISLYLISILIAYVVVTLFVFKSGFFDNFKKDIKQDITHIIFVILCGVLGYIYTTKLI